MSTGAVKIAFWDRVRYIVETIIHLLPIAVLFKVAGIWFSDNHVFAAFFLWSLLGNMLLGAVTHIRHNTFNWSDFFGKNAIILVSLTITYIFLEMLVLVLSDFPPVNYFEMTLQAMTLMYPISKIIKNIYILSGKKYPPKWLMERIYNFEKTGDLEKLLKDEK